MNKKIHEALLLCIKKTKLDAYGLKKNNNNDTRVHMDSIVVKLKSYE